MSMMVTDAVAGPPRGTFAEARSFALGQGAARIADVDDYLRAVFTLAPKVGIDPAIVVAQSAHETANWTSSWWQQRLNPAGIGITGDPSTDAASRTWHDGASAAASQIAHLYLYAVGDLATRPAPEITPEADPRYDAFMAGFTPGFAPTLADLSGTWAVDQAYATKVAAKGNQIFPHLQPATGGTTVTLTFERVPHPDHILDIIDKPDGFGMNLLGPRRNFGVVYHRTLGRSIDGTAGWFKRADVGALTQYGVGAPPPCAAGEDGRIYLWADPRGPVSPWASGRVIAPWGDGAAFVAKFGADAVNQHLIAIEISGLYDDPISETTIDAVAAISAYWADQAHIPWDEYPLHPETGLTFTYWHQEFTGPQEKICPGPVVMDATTTIIERTRAILRAHQAGSVVERQLPPAFDGNDKVVDGVVYHADPRTVRIAVDELNFRLRPSVGADFAREPMQLGQRFRVLYWAEGDAVAGEARWWVTPNGSWAWVGGTAEKPEAA